MRFVKATCGVAALAIVGCASASVPSQQMSQSQAAIRAAEELGAENHPRAALHLKMAKDQMRTARALIESGEGQQARATLMRAEADAELALMLAREARIRAEAREAMNKVRELQQRAESE